MFVALHLLMPILRFLDQDSHVAVMKQTLLFLEGMDSFTMAGEPVFSDDDHRVTFPVRILCVSTFDAANSSRVEQKRVPSSSCLSYHSLKLSFRMCLKYHRSIDLFP